MKEFHHKHSTEKEYNLTHISVDTLISGLVLETSDFQKKVYVMSWRRVFNAFLGIVGNVRSKYFFFTHESIFLVVNLGFRLHSL